MNRSLSHSIKPRHVSCSFRLDYVCLGHRASNRRSHLIQFVPLCTCMYVSYIHTSFPWGVANDFGSRRRLVSTKTWLKRPLLVLCRCMLQTVRKSQRSHPIFIIMARVRVGMCTSIMYVQHLIPASAWWQKSILWEEKEEKKKPLTLHSISFVRCTPYYE